MVITFRLRKKNELSFFRFQALQATKDARYSSDSVGGTSERERMERLNREYNGIDWVGLYNSDKLSFLRVGELSLHFSHHKIPFKGKKAEKVAMIKAHIGSLLYIQWGVKIVGSPRSEMCSNK